MTRPRIRLRGQRRLFSRRPGVNPGRRFALAVVAALSACWALAAPVSADPNPSVVSATVYHGSSGGVSTATLSVSDLNQCPQYSGLSPMYVNPTGQSYQPARGSSWALSTVIQCALNVPLNNVDNVQVSSPHGFETPLSRADLTDPGQFHDPGGSGAAPEISNDGGTTQNTYFRPWRGGSDNNASDEVTNDNGPITIVVFANGAQLTVHATEQAGAQTSSGQTFSLAATVTDQGGASVPDSSLEWSWDFGDGATSTAASPTHFFASGAYEATVQVTDRSGGRGGVDTIAVNAATLPSQSGDSNSPGGGTNTNPQAPPKGPVNGGGNHTGGPPGKQPGKQSPSGHHQPAGNGNSNGRQHTSHKRSGTSNHATTHSNGNPATSGNGGAGGSGGTGGAAGGQGGSSGSPGSNSPSTTPNPPAPGGRHARPPTAPLKPPSGSAPTGPVVSGLLVSDVKPLPAADSPLVHTAPASLASAPALKRATHLSPLPVIAASIAVLLLFAFGAARELRGRRRPRLGS